MSQRIRSSRTAYPENTFNDTVMQCTNRVQSVVDTEIWLDRTGYPTWADTNASCGNSPCFSALSL